MRTVNYIKKELTGVLMNEGLTVGERMAVAYALTFKVLDREGYCIEWDTTLCAERAGVDRECVSRAKKKLADADYAIQLEPRRQIAKNRWTCEIWDLSALVQKLGGVE